jgi:hypothetical protein
MLPQPYAGEAERLLRDYVGVRLSFHRDSDDAKFAKANWASMKFRRRRRATDIHPDIDFQINFVKMRLGAPLAQMRGNHRPEVARPAAQRLVRTPTPRAASRSTTARKLSANRR